MRITVLFLLSCLLTATPGLSQQATQQPISMGEALTFRSEVLAEARTLNVYLPQGYHPDSAQTYPVVYVLDGSLDEDFVHLAGLTQFMSMPWINTMPASIIVGVANVDRKRDFTFPSDNERDNSELPTNGGGGAFTRFLQEEVQPLIARTYRTSGERTLVGQSLGGLFATETLFSDPDLFDRYLIVSPSLWWDDESLLGASPKSLAKVKKIFIAVGAEGPMMERLARTLHIKLMPLETQGVRVAFSYLPERTHGDVLHEAAMQGFEWLFKSAEE